MWYTGFRKDPDAIDVAAIKARVEHWTARHVANKSGMFESFDPPEPYRVVREGDFLIVTPPRSRALRSESWRFSPGQAELTTGTMLFARQRHPQDQQNTQHQRSTGSDPIRHYETAGALAEELDRFLVKPMRC